MAPYSSGSGLTVGFMGIWAFLNTLNWTGLYKLALLYTLTNNSHFIPHCFSQWSINSTRWRYCTNENSYIFWLHWIVLSWLGLGKVYWIGIRVHVHRCIEGHWRVSMYLWIWGTMFPLGVALSSPVTTASHCHSGCNFQQWKPFPVTNTRPTQQPSMVSCQV